MIMKICRINLENKVAYARIEDSQLAILGSFSTLAEISTAEPTTKRVEISAVKFVPPVEPSKIVCVGRNYSAHAAELGNEVPKQPLLFLKAPSSVITNGEIIQIPSQSHQVEHEGELAVIIGKRCKNLGESDDVSPFILGYTCLNDVTARDLQRSDVQFARAKSFDTFCPIGAFLETELDVSDLRVQTFVNGEVRQDGRTSEMVFPVPFLIRYISNQMTLNAGDIIATGTPSGVSKMVDGDIVEVRLEGLEPLINPVFEMG